ncbi:MAG: hypothetical protein ACE15C_19490 [Phycisphaerae bacterium]
MIDDCRLTIVDSTALPRHDARSIDNRKSSIDNGTASCEANIADSPSLFLHIDVDAFFASVEQLLIPFLRGRPVAVGSGVIASCSYEARKFGLRAGMELSRARKLCPQAVILAGNQNIYRCFADRIWEICRRYTVGMETYLDEAYGDATGMEAIHGDGLALGRKLQAAVQEEVGLSVSVGLASNRMVASIASGLSKPHGVAWVRPGDEERFLAPLPIEQLIGVGHKTAGVLHDMNISTIEQLRALPLEAMRAMFGRRGEVLYERCRGRDPLGTVPQFGTVPSCSGEAGDSPREEEGKRRIPRSISRETTFHSPQCDPAQIRGMLFYLLERAMRTARNAGLMAKCVEISIRYDDWKADAASRTLPEATDSDDDAFAIASELLDRLHKRRVALRHVGVALSGLSRGGGQPTLFEPAGHEHRHELYETLDAIRDRFGHSAVVTGKSIELLGRLEQNDYGFILRTPSLTK